MKSFKSLLGPMRVPFLFLTPACVVVGVGTAYLQTGKLSWLNVIIVLIGALAAHISTNIFNEYFDFKSGLDAKTQRTPFSGGSGTLQAEPEMEKSVLVMGWVTAIIIAAVGIYFVILRGWQLLPLGLVGIFLVITYTIWWTKNPVACLLAPGLGFGVLMVMGTHFALTGTYTWTAFIASLLPTFLVSNLLLLNQFPDVEADQSTGRKHYPIAIGREASSTLYGIFLLLAYLSVIVGVILNLLPIFSLLSLLTSILGWKIFQSARQNYEDIEALAPSMGMNVIVNITTPILLAIGLFIG
ncbi:MAG: prenyltransferase [Chloroflexota bacterium]|nr:MAG: prenyltransferase [Chloroflexota bacterium]